MTAWNLTMPFMVVGLVWIAAQYQIWDWWMIVLVLVGLSTYVYPGFGKEREQYLKSMTDYYKARAEYYRKRASS